MLNSIKIHNIAIPRIPDESHEIIMRNMQPYIDGRMDSVQYYASNRGVTNEANIARNIIEGKYGEFCTYVILRDMFGFPELLPDTAIYSDKSKNWSADLPYKSVNSQFPNVHVKTCTPHTISFTGDMSWTFQLHNNNAGGTDDLIAMIMVNPTAHSCNLYATGPWRDIKPRLKQPVSPKLHGKKLCVYAADLC